MGPTLESLRMSWVIVHAEEATSSQKRSKQLNGKSKSLRVAEGEAILASIFSDVAVAA